MLSGFCEVGGDYIILKKVIFEQINCHLLSLCEYVHLGVQICYTQ